MGQITKSLMSVCLSVTSLRSQFSLSFDETLHHSLEPKNEDRVHYGSKSDHYFPRFPPFSHRNTFQFEGRNTTVTRPWTDCGV